MNVSMRPALPGPAMTREQFLEWDGHETGRWEFDGVRAVPMTGGSNNHSMICGLLVYALLHRLRGTDWRVMPGAGLATADGKVRYPEVLVTRASGDGSAKLSSGAVVVFEVVSPSSVRTDRVDKVREYAAVASIRRYVIAEQSAAVLTVYHRDDGSQEWCSLPLGAGETLELPELGIAVPVDEIYEGVAFPGDDAPAG